MRFGNIAMVGMIMFIFFQTVGSALVVVRGDSAEKRGRVVLAALWGLKERFKQAATLRH